MKNRDLALDIIRVLACVMVVFMHAPLPSAQVNGMFLSSLSYFTAPCIGLFFMVSGALLLPPPILQSKEDNIYGFLKKRLGKVSGPTLVWTLVYLLARYGRERFPCLQ